jgi:hypothetical protein
MLLLVAALLALPACTATSAEKATPQAAVPPPPPAETGWRAVVSAEDKQRVADLSQIWHQALQSVPHRYQAQITKEGDLLVAGAGRDHPTPPPGSYKCRLVKLGNEGGREAPVRTFPDFFCYIRAERDNRLSFTKQTGTDLPGGWLHEDGDRRLVLVGAKQRKVGDNSLGYGEEPDRDLIGVIERIGPFRWRLVLPWRGGKPGLDVYELTPVPLAQQAPEPPPQPR